MVMDNSIIITGGNRGLGFYLIKIFLEKGFKVYAIIRHSSNELEELKKCFKNSLYLFNADIKDYEAVKKAVKEIANITPNVDILINNAAIHVENPPPKIEEIDLSVYENTFKNNALAPLNLIRYSVSLVKKSKKKLIVNISSEAGSIGACWREAEFAYCMSKAALNMMSKILQNRYGKEGIKVLAIHPGWFSSDMGGVDAPITPEEAAFNVSNIILKNWKTDDPVFVDTTGKEMAW